MGEAASSIGATAVMNLAMNPVSMGDTSDSRHDTVYDSVNTAGKKLHRQQMKIL